MKQILTCFIFLAVMQIIICDTLSQEDYDRCDEALIKAERFVKEYFKVDEQNLEKTNEKNKNVKTKISLEELGTNITNIIINIQTKKFILLKRKIQTKL